MDFPQRYKKHCPSSSPCRSEIEASYTALDLENPTSIPQRQSSSSPWTTNNTISSSPSPIVSDPVTSPEMSSYRDPLRIIHGTPRVAKTTFPQYPTSIQRHADYLHRPRNALASLSLDVAHEGQSSPSSTQYRTAANMEGPAQHERQHHQHLPSSATRQRSHSPPLPRMRSASGPRRSSVCSGPRSSERLPFVFARIKAKLEAPRRPAIPVITTCPLPIFRATNSFSEEDDRCPSTPSSPLHPLQPIPDDNHYPGEHSYPPQSPSPILTLFGIACSAASQRAYSNTNSDIERSFFKLQHEDSGRVEHRTIAFSTHLTVSRWEPTTAATASTNANSSALSAPASAPATTIANMTNTTDESRLDSGNLRSDNLNNNSNVCMTSLRGSITGTASSGQDLRPKSHSPSPHTSPSLKYHRRQEQQPSQQPSDPVYAARLMSLANYIRHIISLSSGNSPLHSQIALVLQQQQQRQQRQQMIQGNKSTSYPSGVNFVSGGSGKVGQDHSSSLPSPLSAGPGPIKSTTLSARRHRHASEYHDYQARRQMHHQQQGSSEGRHDYGQQQQQQQQQEVGQGQQIGHAHLDPAEMQMHRLPSPISPTSYNSGRLSQQQQQQQQQQQHVNGAPSVNAVKPFSPLLKVPFANLTLTLALIYVDRLKAKYPEAKGEAGCSHRLFLVAYIIAAKYRCSVELAALLQEHRNSLLESRGNDHSNAAAKPRDRSMSASHMSTNNGSSSDNTSSQIHDRSDATEKKLWEARSHAELIFSNHEWVRLLSLGSFFRPPAARTSSLAGSTSSPSTSPSTPTPSSSAIATASGSNSVAATARTSPTQPMVQRTSSSSEPKPLPIQSTPFVASSSPSCDTKTYSSSSQNAPMLTPATPTPSSSLSMTSSILQVEDLDRMETEFLTFLDYDLSTRSQDLDTCWSLLVGNKEF